MVWDATAFKLIKMKTPAKDFTFLIQPKLSKDRKQREVTSEQLECLVV